jgi:hypothetical protein
VVVWCILARDLRSQISRTRALVEFPASTVGGRGVGFAILGEGVGFWVAVRDGIREGVGVVVGVVVAPFPPELNFVRERGVSVGFEGGRVSVGVAVGCLWAGWVLGLQSPERLD